MLDLHPKPFNKACYELSPSPIVVGAIAKPKLGMQPKPFGEACYASWQDGDSTKD